MNEAKLSKLKGELSLLEKTYLKFKVFFNKDGVIDAREKKQLGLLQQMIDRVKEGIRQAEADIAFANGQQPADDGTQVKETGVVTATKLNVRSGPGTSHDKTGKQLKQGDQVNIYEDKDGWHRIGEGEWVSGDYVTTKDEEGAQNDDEPVVEVSGSGPSSPNFKFTEFVPLYRPYYKHANNDPKKAVPQELWPNIQKVMNNLEVIRAEIGKPLKLNSGYRNEAHNAAVGGAKNSQHKKGKAADFRVDGMTPKQVHAIVLRLIDEGKISQGGVGLYSTFVHYDVRGTRARW